MEMYQLELNLNINSEQIEVSGCSFESDDYITERYSLAEVKNWLQKDKQIKQHYKAVKKALIEALKLPPRLEDCNFETFDSYNEDLKTKLDSLKEYSKMLAGDQANSVFLAGNVGNGKTHLAVSIVKEVIEYEALKNVVEHKLSVDKELAKDPEEIIIDFSLLSGFVEVKGAKDIIFMQGPELFQEIRDSFNDDSKNSSSIMKNYKESDILIWDDILTAKKTEWVLEQMHLLISYRYKEQKPVIFTSNLPVEYFKKLSTNQDDYRGKRIFSRIVDMCSGNLYKFDHEDYRLNYN